MDFRQINMALIIILGSALLAFSNCHPGHEDAIHSKENKGINPYHITAKYELMDVKSGEMVSQDNFKGKLQVIFFGFTYCQTICPVGLQNLKAVLNELGDKADDISPIFISFDLQRDSASVVQNFIGNFDSRIVGLIGNEKQMSQTLKSFRIEYHKIGDSKNPAFQMDHPAVFMIVGKKGEFLGSLPSSGDPKTLAKNIQDWL